MNRIRAAVLGLTLVAAGVRAPAVLAECNPSNGSSNAVAGAVVGAIIGGLLGSAVGKGDGKVVAIGAGALAGGFLGNRFGASLDCVDQQYHHDTAQQTLENRRSGSTSTWRNPDTGHSGSVTPLRTYLREDGTYCRDFEQSVSAAGQTERERATACRQDDATWRVVG